MTVESLDARLYLDHLAREGTVLPDLGDSVLLAMHPAARPRRGKSLGGPFAIAERARGESIPTVSPLGPGPAVAAMTVDMLACLGVKRLIVVGVASAVVRGDDAVAIGSTAVIHGSIADEVVSGRYGGHLQADVTLTDLLGSSLVANKLISYSTATPFRLDVAAVMDSGADLVEMESSAIFAASRCCSIATSAVVVVSDFTSAQGWIPGDKAVVAPAVSRLAESCRQLLGATS